MTFQQNLRDCKRRSKARHAGQGAGVQPAVVLSIQHGPIAGAFGVSRVFFQLLTIPDAMGIRQIHIPNQPRISTSLMQVNWMKD